MLNEGLIRKSKESPVVLRTALCCFLSVAFYACENDLKEIERVSSIGETPIDVTLGVELIYSDSAVVKAKIISSKMIHQSDSNPYYEFPDDVLVIFYNEQLKEERRVTADYGIYREQQKLVELRNNVVATMSDGTVFRSEELFWDDDKRIFYNTLPLTITNANGDVGEGSSFESDENFKNRKIRDFRSTYKLKEGEGL